MPPLDEKYTMEPQEARHEPQLLLCTTLSSSTLHIPQNKNVLLEPSKKGRCWTELNTGGMLNWGMRKKVQFLRNDETEKVDTEEEDGSIEQMKENRKRKRPAHMFITSREKKNKKKKGTKNLSYRWSKERYKMAELNMLKILKEKEDLFGKPILT